MMITIVGLALAGLVGCQLWENDRSTPTSPGAAADLAGFIMGNPEITSWGAQYAAGNSYVMVNIPVSGALQISYGIKDGGAFDLFLDTTLPVEPEIRDHAERGHEHTFVRSDALRRNARPSGQFIHLP